jgi:hypothetical protein
LLPGHSATSAYRKKKIPIRTYNFNPSFFTSLVFEKRVLRRVFPSKGDEVKGEWRKLHDEELYNLYFTKYYKAIKS